MSIEYKFMKNTSPRTRKIIEGYIKWLDEQPEMALYDEWENIRQEIMMTKKVEVREKWRMN